MSPIDRPLQGRRIVVTRSADQADPLSDTLQSLGALPLPVPAIRSAPAPDPGALSTAAEQLGGTRWLGFTSPSGVRYGWPAVEAAWPQGLPEGLGLAAVGPGTAEALAAAGRAPDFLPSDPTGDAFASELPVVRGDRVVLLRSDIARRAVAERLRARGARVADVAAYRTVEGADAADVRRALAAFPAAITFTSPSTVRGFLRGMGPARAGAAGRFGGAALVAIGPVTAAEVGRHGLAVDAVAAPSTLTGLVDALLHLLA